MASVRLDVEVMVEEREGYFAALTKPFAITTYGDTPEQAEQRALKAVALLLNTKLGKNLSNYLNHRGVKHIVQTERDVVHRHPVVRECRQEVRIPELTHA